MKLIDEIYNMYAEVGMGSNEICIRCKSLSKSKGKELINGPVPLFHIGDNFSNNKVRLLIVGMVAYGWSDIISNSLGTDPWGSINSGDIKSKEELKARVCGRYEEIFFKENQKITKYLRVSLSNIFGDTQKAFDNVAITNYVHCNQGTTKDNLPQKVRNLCSNISENGFIHKEIEIIKPTHVLSISSSWKYNRYLYGKGSYNFLSVAHPSSIGRSYTHFEQDIRNFIGQHDNY